MKYKLKSSGSCFKYYHLKLEKVHKIEGGYTEICNLTAGKDHRTLQVI